jgi:hypothetical protein
MHKGGVDLRTVQELVGHKSIEVTVLPSCAQTHPCRCGASYRWREFKHGIILTTFLTRSENFGLYYFSGSYNHPICSGNNPNQITFPLMRFAVQVERGRIGARLVYFGDRFQLRKICV